MNDNEIDQLAETNDRAEINQDDKEQDIKELKVLSKR